MTSVPDRIADDIEREILAQRLDSGARFALRTELIERFGVSASAMNEALRILRERGVVQVKPGAQGGVFIAQPPPQVRLGVLDLWFRGLQVDAVELFEARSALEDSLSGVAAERATPADARDLDWALEELRERRADPRLYLEATMRFHGVIARAARIPVLAGMYESVVTLLRGALVRAEFAVPDAQAALARNIEVHARLAKAIAAGDREALAAALADHRVDLVRLGQPDRSPGRDSR
ncbi:FadR/GntR family transcriptional regulator [Crossiella cryophila]|uniref:GntR family transcriptional repressor for pyruvate dehydrogenase complex n=1 Tax=Crossiella cryophila TaxID=43355 RepID=A0A7W7FWH1_9PSEU|nr:FCD domain-containing protein [Crossiella cryophila]MBB4680045.1 GntR family transcriptional repressor for pyruvate dehydrogenase complex [Crossiella cryophila]